MSSNEKTKEQSPQTPRSLTHYATDIPILGYATVNEPSQPLPGQFPTEAPTCPVYLIDRLTPAIIDHMCAFTNISTSFLDTLFPGKWQKWLKPTREGLQSATKHPLKIIGKIPYAKIEIGSIELFNDVQVVKDSTPTFIIGNDIAFDRITNHDGRFVTVRCQPGKPAREILPLTYGNQVVYAALAEKVTIKPHKGAAVKATLVGSTGGKKERDYLNSFRNENVQLENIRYGPKECPDDIVNPIRVDETIKIVDDDLQVEVWVVNDDYQFRTLEKGALLARVAKGRVDKLSSGSAYFVQTDATESPEELIAQMYHDNRSPSKNDATPSPQPDFSTASDTDSVASTARPFSYFMPSAPLSPETNQRRIPRHLLMPSHKEDFRRILEGSEDGDIPLPSGYELADFPAEFEPFSIDDIKTPWLTPEERERVLAICRARPSAWAQHSGDIGHCTYGEFDMDIGDTVLKPDPYRPTAAAYVDEVDQLIQRMEKMKVISLTDSPYATNLVVARRPNSALRVCLDSRRVNLHLKNLTAWPIPPQSVSLEKLAVANVTSSLDFFRAFWSIKLSKRAQPLCSFYHKSRLYAYLVAPFGIRSLPGYYNSLMAHLTRDMNEFSYFFFDDLLIMSKNFEEHLDHLGKILDRVVESGFKLKPSKCQLCVPKSQPLNWLGNIVVNNQLIIDPVKINAIKELPYPTTGKELLRALSIVSFVRKFIPHLATVVAPLQDLVNSALRKKNPEYKWEQLHADRFDLMRQLVIHAPGLRLIKPENPLRLTSDASKVACGNMLTMMDDIGDGKGPQEFVCGYASRRFTTAEIARLTCPEKELSGLLYASACWSQYLIGKDHFYLITDVTAFLYIHCFKSSNPRLMKAALHLEELNYEIVHMSAKDGNSMAVCDYLSRAYAEVPEITLSWQQLRCQIFDQIRAPPDWPSRPLSKHAFATYADEYFRNFHPEFPSETKELDQLKIEYFYKGKDDPEAKERILARERELKNEYCRYRLIESRRTSQDKSPSADDDDDRPPTPTDISKPDRDSPNRTSSPLRTTHFDTDEAQPPSFNRSLPSSPSYSSSDTNSFPLGASELEYSSNEDDCVNDNSADPDKKPQTRPNFCLLNFNDLTKNDPISMTSVPGVGELTPSQMIALQRADDETRHLINKYEALSPENKLKSPYFYQQGVFSRHMIFKKKTYDAVVVPKVLRLDVIRAAHGDGLGVGHNGPRKTQRYCHRQFYWKNMAQHIRLYCESCVNCALNQPTTKRQVDFQRRMGTPSMTVNSDVSVDLIINLPTAVGGYRHIAVFVDNFSRFTVMCPVRTKEPQETARVFLTRYCSIIGIPLTLHSDAGSEVDASFMQRFCKLLSIRKSRTPSYSPNSNSIVETVNKSVGALLRTASFPKHLSQSWPVLLPFIQLTLNELTHTAHGLRPREVLFTACPSFIRLPLVSWDSPIIDQDDFLKATRAGQELAWNTVRAEQMRIRSPKEKANRRHGFRVGDWITIKDHKIGEPQTNKLKTKYKGVYRVLQVYHVALVVQKWLGADDPLVTQGLLHHHKIDAKHVECRIVNARDCKLYPNMEKVAKGPGIHPTIIQSFLKQLGYKTPLEDVESVQDDDIPYERRPESGSRPDSSDDASHPDKNSPDDQRGLPQADQVLPVTEEQHQETVSTPLPTETQDAKPIRTSSEQITDEQEVQQASGDLQPREPGIEPDPPPSDSPQLHPTPRSANDEPIEHNEQSPPQETPPAKTTTAPNPIATPVTPPPPPSRPSNNKPTTRKTRRHSAPSSNKVADERPHSPDPREARRIQPARKTKTAWKQDKWPQVLQDLKPRSRHHSTPSDSNKHLAQADVLLTRDMDESRRKNDPSAPQASTPTQLAARTLYDQRIAAWLNQNSDVSSDSSHTTKAHVTQHELDEKSAILVQAYDVGPQGDVDNPSTRSSHESNDRNAQATSDLAEEPVSGPLYANLPP